MFSDSTRIVGDFHARYLQLEMVKVHDNGIVFYQFLKDRPEARLLGGKDATYNTGGWLDYACLLGGQGIQGECEVVREPLGDHFVLLRKLDLGKKGSKFQRRGFTLDTNARPHKKEKKNMEESRKQIMQ